MSTLTSRRPSSKPLSRTFRWLYRHPGEQLKGAIRMVLTFPKRSEIYRYWVEQIPSDFGTAFKLERIEADGSEGDTYHACAENEQDGYCDCKGFQAHGHCKHRDLAFAISQKS